VAQDLGGGWSTAASHDPRGRLFLPRDHGSRLCVISGVSAGQIGWIGGVVFDGMDRGRCVELAQHWGLMDRWIRWDKRFRLNVSQYVCAFK
jgi:hypothetical protein